MALFERSIVFNSDMFKSEICSRMSVSVIRTESRPLISYLHAVHRKILGF